MRCDRGYGWGSKDMDEGMHPYHYSCPLSFLDPAPVQNKDRHEKVRFLDP